MPLRLYAFPFSHFCERARWGLHHAGIEFDEVSWAPGVHLFLVRRLGCKQTSVPILDTGDAVIQGSDRILNYCGMKGFDEVLEKRFETRIAPLVRQYIYSGTLFHSASAMGSFLLDGVHIPQKLAGRVMWPITRKAMISMINCRPDLLASLEADLEAEFGWFEAHLQGRQYVSEGEFGRSDITAASLFAPWARPEQCPIYRRVKLPPEMEQKLAAWEERPAIAWARRMYDRHRVRN
jgi:glutathione S-transferase